MHFKLNYVLAYIYVFTRIWSLRGDEKLIRLGDVPIARRGILVVASAKGGFPKIGESYSDHGASIRHATTVRMLFATSDGV